MATVLLCIPAPCHVTVSEKQRHQKLADFTAKCKLLLDESVCLAKEICTTQHSIGLFYSLSTALRVFISECNRVQSWFNGQLQGSTLGLLPPGLLLPSASIPPKQPVSLTAAPQHRKPRKMYLSTSVHSKPRKVGATMSTGVAQSGSTPPLPSLSDGTVLNNVRFNIAVPKEVTPQELPVLLRPCPPFPPEPSIAVEATRRRLLRQIAASAARQTSSSSSTDIGDIIEEAVSGSVVASVDRILSDYLPEEFICDFCGEQLPLQESFLVHVRTHTNALGEYPCDKCYYKAGNIFALRRHKADDCGRVYQCAICAVTRAEKTALVAHIESRHAGSSLRVWQCEKSYTCGTCNATIKGTRRYEHHLLTHSANVICDQCGLRTCCEQHLERHWLIHMNELPVKCDVESCTAAFKTRLQMRAHFKRIHAKLLSHACQQCERRFYDEKALGRHMLRHTGECPYPCYVCGHGFSQRIDLRIHLRCVHKMTLDKSKLAAQQRKGTAKSSRVNCEPPDLETPDEKAEQKGSNVGIIRMVSPPEETANEVSAMCVAAQDELGLLPVEIDPISAAQLSASSTSSVPENDVLTFYNNPVDADMRHEYIFNPFLA